MHRLLIAFLFVTLSPFARAQEGGMKIKFHKDRPVQMLSYGRLYDANNTSTSKRKLKKSDRFTDAEVDEIFRRLGNDALLPPGINRLRSYTPDQSLGAHYRMYEQSSFSLLGYHFSLVWIPKDENMHMPADLQPPTSEGSLWYTYTENLSKNGKDAKGGTLAKAGTPVGSGGMASSGSNGSIQVSSADMSGVSRRHGTMVIYYGSKSSNGKLNISNAYFYEVVGTGYMSDAASLAAKLSRKADGGAAYVGYEWKGGYDCDAAIGWYVRSTGASGGTGRCDGTVTPSGD